MKEVKFIKDFNQINIKKICEEYGFNPKNIYSGKARYDAILTIYFELQYRLKKLLLDDEYDMIMNKEKIEVLEDEKND